MSDQSKDVWFSQAVLNANEFIVACEKLRENRSFRFSPRRIRPHQINAIQINRMVFPLDHLPTHPAFPGPQSDSVKAFNVEWNALAMNSPVGFGITEQRFAGSPFRERERTIFCELTIGDFDVQLKFLWEAESARCDRFEINWFVSGDRVMDWASRLQIGGALGSLGQIEISPKFRRAREKQVRKELPFLDATRLDPAGGFNYKSTSPHGKLVWEAFLDWMGNAEADLSFATRICLGTPQTQDEKSWRFEDVWELVKTTGAIEGSVEWLLHEDFIVRRARKFAGEYHRWVAEMVGLQTVSERAAIFDLGVLRYELPGEEDDTEELGEDLLEDEDDSPQPETETYVTAFLLPDGVVLGYCDPDAASKRPPKEILSITEGAEWIQGCPPERHKDKLPTWNWGDGEQMDPVPGVTTEAQLKVLVDAVQRWTDPPRGSVRSGSLEEQLENFEKLGFAPAEICDVEDFLEIHPRSWYEEVSYANTLRCLGSWERRGHCERLWLLDTRGWRSEVDHCTFFKRLKSLHPGAIDVSRIATAGGNESGIVRLRFEVGGDRHEWAIEESSPDRTAVELIEAFDQLLEDLGSVPRVYAYSPADGKYVLSILSPDKARDINRILPISFKQFRSMGQTH